MAWEVTWTTPALDDLDEISTFIERDSSYYAAALVNEVFEAARSLETLARRGQPFPSSRIPSAGSC